MLLRRFSVGLGLAASVIAIAACGSSDSDDTSATGATPPKGASASASVNAADKGRLKCDQNLTSDEVINYRTMEAPYARHRAWRSALTLSGTTSSTA